MAQINEVAARIMEHLCTHDGNAGHGYSQAARWGSGSNESIKVDGKTYTFAGGDRDCSSAIISAYKAAGLNVNATYTGNMRAGFLATGLFEWKPLSFTAQRGDIYLNEVNHTAMCVSAVPDKLAEFSISETGGITGKVGDQTARESSIKNYYNYPWNGILHFKGGNGSNAKPTPAPTGNAKNPPDSIRYSIYTKEDGWLPFADAGKTCGKQNHVARFIAVDLKGHGWYQVKTQESGWLSRITQCNQKDTNHGCAGDGSPILAVRIYYTTPKPGETGYWQAKYRVSTKGKAFYDWQYDNDTWNGQDGYAGDGRNAIDRLQLSLAKV